MARIVVGHQQIAMNGEPRIEPLEGSEGRTMQSDVDVNERERLAFEPDTPTVDYASLKFGPRRTWLRQGRMSALRRGADILLPGC